MPPTERVEPTYAHAGVIAESERDGWLLGLIGEPCGPWPKRCGDVYVVAPGGAQAGIAWESTGPAFREIDGPSPGRWGVFQVLFPIPVMCRHDLVRNFHEVLPLLKDLYARHLSCQSCSAGA
jgi:hypothetical protein